MYRIILTTIVALVALGLTGCGGGQNSTSKTAAAFVPYSSGLYFNPTPSTASLTVSGASSTGTSTPKTLNLQAGDTIDANPVRPSITVSSCLAPSTPDIKVCYESDDLQPNAESLGVKLTELVSHVEKVVGPTGKVDILVAHPGTTIFSGVYNNGTSGNRTVVVTGSNNDAIQIIAVHELAHAAYQYANGDLNLPWLNEAVATLAETETGSFRQYRRFNNVSLTTRPADSTDYYRSQKIGLELAKYGSYPLGPKLSQPDPVKAITGMDLASFVKAFWLDNVSSTPVASAGVGIVPAYGAVQFDGNAVGSDFLQQLFRTVH